MSDLSTIRDATSAALPRADPARTPSTLRTADATSDSATVAATLPAVGVCSVDQAIARVLDLRNLVNSGHAVAPKDLVAATEPTLDNSVQLFTDRNFFDDGLIPALKAAKRSVHLAYLQFDGSFVGKMVADALIDLKKKNPNIRIRVEVDDLASQHFVVFGATFRNQERMRKAGIELVENSLPKNGLEHRKIAIIDGNVAFLGASCPAEKYYASKEYASSEKALEKAERTHDAQKIAAAQAAAEKARQEQVLPQYHDYGVRIEGGAVRHLQASFLQAWMLHGQKLEPGLSDAGVRREYFPTSVSRGLTPIALTHAVPGGPSQMRTALLELVRSAKRTLTLEIAYVDTREFVDALAEAARRGVKVRLLSNSEKGTNIQATYYAFFALYPELLANDNIEIYEFNQMTHVKVAVADGERVMLSTGNPISFEWDDAFEENAVVDSRELARDVSRQLFQPDFSPARSHRVTAEDVANANGEKKLLTKTLRFLFDWLLPPRPR